MHEHVFWDYDARWREACIDFSRQELEKLSQAGGRTVVDVAPHPYRIPEWYLALAPQVDIRIIVSTGFYLERRTPLKFHAYTESQMVERFLAELTEGIQGSNLKAGVIKVAGECAHLTAWEERVLRAAGARAARDRRPDLRPRHRRRAGAAQCSERGGCRPATHLHLSRRDRERMGGQVGKPANRLPGGNRRRKGAACISAISAGSSSREART